MRSNTEFSRLKSVEVTVEERQITIDISSNNWRTHVFTGLDAVPQRLPAAFRTDTSQEDLDLLDLVHRCYRRGCRQIHHDAPYHADGTSRGPTVLRSVDIKMQYLA
jgi:hypothetical protein